MKYLKIQLLKKSISIISVSYHSWLRLFSAITLVKLISARLVLRWATVGDTSQLSTTIKKVAGHVTPRTVRQPEYSEHQG